MDIGSYNPMKNIRKEWQSVLNTLPMNSAYNLGEEY